jgi:hypothetical protein
MEVSSSSMKVARVTVRAMIQGLMAGRAAFGPGFGAFAGSGGEGGAVLTGSIRVAVAIGSDLLSESLWTLDVPVLYTY